MSEDRLGETGGGEVGLLRGGGGEFYKGFINSQHRLPQLIQHRHEAHNCTYRPSICLNVSLVLTR